MAERDDDAERSEEPTQKKLEQAQEKGDVAKSQEVSAWFVLSGATLVLAVFAGGMADAVADAFRGLLANVHQVPFDGYGLTMVMERIGMATAAAVGVPLFVLALAALAGNLVQHKPVWSLEPMKPKLSKISPMKGFTRLFSAQSLVNFGKGIAKLVIVSAVMFLIIWPQRDRLDALITLDVSALLEDVNVMALKLLAGVIAILTVVAAVDFAWQRHSWLKRQRMSLREIKEEHKQSEGDPMVRAKLRQIRIERGRRRMMAQVPEATVVVANPTHYAVALKYEPGMSAPRCVAKGIDAVAQRIRQIAEEAEVPVVENPPLARTLHAAVEVDREIAPEHYKAVAEIIGYVMQVKARAGWRSNRR